MHADQLINEWGMLKYREYIKQYPHWKMNNHLASCDTAEAKQYDAKWECWCYSEVTREDTFMIYFTISCNCDESYDFSFSEWEWDLPTVLRELQAFSENPCYYESDEWADYYN
jgi:hypothetical protein